MPHTKGFAVSDLTPYEGESPFEDLRRIDLEGREFWSARDLMDPLGYDSWRRFDDAIERAKDSACNSGYDCDSMFMQVRGVIDGSDKNLGGRPSSDYRLTRMAAYLLAMNGDPRKSQIAAAQAYFAIKTREAEIAPRHKPGDLNLLRAMIDEIEQDRARLAALERVAVAQQASIAQITAKQAAQDGAYGEFTTLAYAKLNNLPSDRPSCQRHGQRATRLMKSRGQTPRKREDATFGTVNVYPVDVLDETAETI